MTMDIRAPYMTPVIVVHDDIGNVLNGTPSDKELVAQHLKLDTVYYVHHTDVGDWATKVYLMEVPGVTFNSVNFKEVKL